MLRGGPPSPRPCYWIGEPPHRRTPLKEISGGKRSPRLSRKPEHTLTLLAPHRVKRARKSALRRLAATLAKIHSPALVQSERIALGS
ncbi:hypothetical protein SCMU_00310 [Sinomonas cyclohexanicum]|uniref:Uncharacterized protein n=1 Tax=Sinomonas cyclohexanicum TaxID=322009 RepID=A0ABM7PQ61_SINCY|nr:hypothetical protein SCMU_00310 [Corynebacterium cyclohexanicum]